MLADQFELSPGAVATVSLAVLCVYSAWLAVVRIGGRRALLVSSASDFAFVAAIGALLGRTVLLQDPTIAVGAVALVTFALLHATTVRLTRIAAVARALGSRPLLLVADGQIISCNLRRARGFRERGSAGSSCGRSGLAR